jgi:hypothetical protein
MREGSVVESENDIIMEESPLKHKTVLTSRVQPEVFSEAEAKQEAIQSWCKTFNRQFAGFVLFENGTGVVFLKKNLEKVLMATASSTTSKPKNQEDILSERAIALFQTADSASPKSTNSLSTAPSSHLQHQSQAPALQMHHIQKQPCPSALVNSVAINKLKDGAGYMLLFDSPHILTFVSEKELKNGIGTESEPDHHLIISRIGFQKRNYDANQHNIIHIQTCSFD